MTHLPKHKFLSPNNHFYQRIWCVEYYSVDVYMVWSHKFRKLEISLDTGSTPAPALPFYIWQKTGCGIRYFLSFETENWKVEMLDDETLPKLLLAKFYWPTYF